MSLPRFNKNVENISALADRPNDVNGLTAAELKARFDKADGDIKSWINNTLIPYLEGRNAAANIGIAEIDGFYKPGTTTPVTNVQDAIEALKLGVDDAIAYASGNRRSPAFSITGGTYAYKEQAVAGSDQNNWELALLSGKNAKITFARTTGPIDVFLIGGGSAGDTGRVGNNVAYGGHGGRSGKRVTRLNMEIEEGVSYSFTVGGPGLVTKIFGILSSSGTYTDGSIGAVADVSGTGPATIETDTAANGEYAFGEATSLLFSGRKYGAGGGGGGASAVKTIFYVNSEGNTRQEDIQVTANGAHGGMTGGGNGSSSISQSATSGADNTGSGGGGAFARAYNSNGSFSSAGVGGSGIIIIRNARG